MNLFSTKYTSQLIRAHYKIQQRSYEELTLRRPNLLGVLRARFARSGENSDGEVRSLFKRDQRFWRCKEW